MRLQAKEHYFSPSPSRPVPLAQAAAGLAAKSPAKAGKTSSYSEYCPCPANLLRFWMRMAIRSSATAMMRGARRCGVPASWPEHWALCSPSGIAATSMTKKRGCIISEVDITTLTWADLLMRIECLMPTLA